MHFRKYAGAFTLGNFLVQLAFFSGGYLIGYTDKLERKLIGLCVSGMAVLISFVLPSVCDVIQAIKEGERGGAR